MTALTDALAACIQIHENQGALADPVAMAAAAELAFKQAVVAAIDEMLANTASVGAAIPPAIPAQQAANGTVMTQADFAALAAKINADMTSATAAEPAGNAQASPAAASSAVEAPVATPVAPAAELPPTIAPSTGA